MIAVPELGINKLSLLIEICMGYKLTERKYLLNDKKSNIYMWKKPFIAIVSLFVCFFVSGMNSLLKLR
jgi:hypothetical protein